MKQYTPCPFVNMLVKKKRIPVKNITISDLQHGIHSMNVFDESLLTFIKYLIVTPAVNQLSSNGVISSLQDLIGLEHDISLSRLDKYQGDCISFNKIHFEKLKDKSKNKTHLTLHDIAEYRKDLIQIARKNNPQFKFGIVELIVSCGEDAFLQVLFSDETGDIRLEWITTFFTTENLPTRKDGFYRKNITFGEWIYAFITHLHNLHDI